MVRQLIHLILARVLGAKCRLFRLFCIAGRMLSRHLFLASNGNCTYGDPLLFDRAGGAA